MVYKRVFKYSCGHEKSVEVSEKDQAGYINIETPCMECRQKELKDKLTRSELEDLCKPLKAVSEKQLKYADKIRGRFINYWTNAASSKQADKIRLIIKNEKSAGWWLDNLGVLQDDGFIDSYESSVKKSSIKNKQASKDNVMFKKEVIKLLQDCLVRPCDVDVNVSAEMLVYVVINKNCVCAKPFGCGENLEKILPKFCKQNSYYVRIIKEINGNIKDRYIESCLDLLLKGYYILAESKELRSDIINKNFKPEPTKWFKFYDDRAVILTWEGDEKTLCNRVFTVFPNAQQDEKCNMIKIPLSSKCSIFTFAAANGIEIEKKLEDILKNPC